MEAISSLWISLLFSSQVRCTRGAAADADIAWIIRHLRRHIGLPNRELQIILGRFLGRFVSVTADRTGTAGTTQPAMWLSH